MVNAFPYLLLILLPPTIRSEEWTHYIEEGCELRGVTAERTLLYTKRDFVHFAVARHARRPASLTVVTKYQRPMQLLRFNEKIPSLSLIPAVLFARESPARVEFRLQWNETRSLYFPSSVLGSRMEIKGENIWTTVGNCTSGLPYEVLDAHYKYLWLLSPEPRQFLIISTSEGNASNVKLYDLSVCWNEVNSKILMVESGSPCQPLPKRVSHQLTISYDSQKKIVQINDQRWDSEHLNVTPSWIDHPLLQFVRDGDNDDGHIFVVHCLYECQKKPEDTVTAACLTSTPAPTCSFFTVLACILMSLIVVAIALKVSYVIRERSICLKIPHRVFENEIYMASEGDSDT